MSERDLVERVAGHLREWRQRRGVTREQLAAKADVDAQMIKRIENGRANPALVVLSRLSSALAISLSLMLSTELSAAPLLPEAAAEAEPFDAMNVGETIRSLRKNRHLSRRGLAKLVEVRPLTLSRYETGETDTRMLVLEPLARALGVDAEEFVRAVEVRHRSAERSGNGWHASAEGVLSRRISQGECSQLWEWRLAPEASYVGDPAADVVEEIATAIRGDVTVSIDNAVHHLRRGASLNLPVDRPRTFGNAGASTARLLCFQVRK
jgi:transcriptional regulator with XRE-family HTH domain